MNEYEAVNRDLFLHVEDEMLHDLYSEVLGSGGYVLYKLVHLDTDDAGMGYDVYDYNEEISVDECNRGSERLKEGMEDMVFERI